MEFDGNAVAGMIFSLLCLVVIGGIILMYPLTRRLGQLMEQRLEERRQGRPEAARAAGAGEGASLGEIKASLRALEGEVVRLGERQRFLEGLLESGAARKELTGP